MTLNWSAATESGTAASALSYRVCTATDPSTLNTTSGCQNATTVMDFNANITSVTVSSLSPGTTYYYNVLVQDLANNTQLYSGTAVTTLGITAAPTFSLAGGTYASSQAVALASATQGAKIYYTLDGSQPTAASAVYQTPLQIAVTSTIKAYAVQSGMMDSAAAVITYVITGTVASVQIATVAHTGSTTINFSTSTAGVTICYNQSGGTPSCSGDKASCVVGTLGNSVVVTNSATVSAIACKAGWTDSSVASQAISVTYPIVPGAGGAITATPGATSVSLSWTAATETNLSPSNLSYQVYYSSTGQVDSLADLANGTPFGSLTANITTAVVTGLTPGTSYNINVYVTDGSNGQAVYTQQVNVVPLIPGPICTDGTVYAVAESASATYLGGSFAHAGWCSGGGIPIDATTGKMAVDYTHQLPISGQVYASASDGYGGWYLGGSFVSIGGSGRSNLAHIRADGTLANWGVSTNGPVYSLIVFNNSIFIGGNFTAVNGGNHSNIAQISPSGGVISSWTASTDHVVYTLAGDNGLNVIYAGGAFTTANQVTRSYLAAFGGTGSNGAVLPDWNPNADGPVHAITVVGTSIYVGGAFITMNNVAARSHIAALDNSFGLVTNWNPGANGTVESLLASGSVLYVGGNFSTIGVGNASRTYVAAIDLSTATAMAFGASTSIDHLVNALALNGDGTTLYIGGNFTTVDGSSRSHLAALDTISSTLLPWNPNTSGLVDALTADGANVYVGGKFTFIDGQKRSNTAAVDSSGALLPWDANVVGGTVRALVYNDSNSTVYLGGDFTSVGNQTRNNLASVNGIAAGLNSNWNPSPNASVLALAVSGSNIYAGGTFSSVGATALNHLAQIDLATGAPSSSWNPNPNGTFVKAIAVNGTNILVGGDFSAIGGLSQSYYIAALDSGIHGFANTTWVPAITQGAGNYVDAIAVAGSAVVFGGKFVYVDGQIHNNLAAVDLVYGSLVLWNPIVNNDVYAIKVSGADLYIGGAFSTIGGDSAYNHLAAFANDESLTLKSAWTHPTDASVYALGAMGSNVTVGGCFSTIDGNISAGVSTIPAAN